MRTDVKIGITTGLVVSVGILLYFIITSGGINRMRKLMEPPTLATSGPSNTLETGDGNAAAPRADLPTAQPPAAPGIPAPAAPAVVSSRLKPAGSGGEAEMTTLPEPAKKIEPAKGTEVVRLDPGKIESVHGSPETTRLEPVSPTALKAPEGQTGVVPATADANRAAADSAKSSGEPGSVVTMPNGDRYYIVKKGDNGLWAVAETVYKDGRKWDIIAHANQESAHGPLRPGQRLLIPPLAKGADPVAAHTPASMPSTRAAGDTYIVKEGDGGYESIARKAYNDGSLWQAIAKANPGVDSSHLRVGQELILPSIEEARRMLGVTGSSGGSTTKPAVVHRAPAKPASSAPGKPGNPGAPGFD